MEETIEGYVDHIIYQNRDNGYTVACLVSQGEEITCVGNFRFLNEEKQYGSEACIRHTLLMEDSFL